jgi:uncharacterized repeat protein (TIGR01451 family)
MLTNSTKKISMIAVLSIVSFALSAQNSIRAFNQVYSENIKGGTTMFGNTILHIVDNNVVNLTKMNQTSSATNGVGGIGFSQYGNDGSNMQQIDIDNNSSTVNSSSADLVLPSGSNTIRFARLYWGGKIDNSVITSHPDTLRKIKIRKGTTGNYFSATTPSINVDQFAISSTEKSYQSFIDITSYVNANGSGTYTVADLPVTPGSSSTGGRYGGWVIVVAYENATQPYNSVRLYDGFAQVYNNGTTAYLTINLSGLNVPSTPLLANEAIMGTMAWEGDANLSASSTNPQGDFIKINNATVSNSSNPATNFWNGSITNNDGSFVTTKNPNYSNQMGIDIDQVNVGTGYNIAPNATSVTVQFGTEADMYFPSVFTFQIKVKDPTVVLTKTVADANLNGYVDSQEELTYTLSGSNQGVGSAYNTFIVDSLPNNVTYIPNSIEIVSAPGVTSGIKTDAADNDQAFIGTVGRRTYLKVFIGTGATGNAGGELPSGTASNYTIKFKVRAFAIPGTIINSARISGTSVVGDLFTDDGTAVIGESGAPMPVKFTSFNASLLNDRSALLKWVTQSEVNNDYFEIERSTDGVHFESRGKVTGNGSTSMTHNYSFTDVININAPIIYYRLRIMDNDGKYTFSKIIALKVNGSISVDNFNVFPNPFITDIKVSLTSAEDVNAGFRILSFDGKEIQHRTIGLQKGNNIVVLNDFGTLPKGNYILEVSTATEKLIKKIVKN